MRSLFFACALIAPASLMVSGCGKSEQVTPSAQIAALTDESDPDTAKAMADVNLKALLKDPESAKFRKVVITKIAGGNLMLCGEVKSKNGFGGYTGYRKFIASPNPDAPTIIDGEISEISYDEFRRAYAIACANVVARYS